MKINKATMRAVDRRGTPVQGEHAAKVTLKGDIRLVLTPNRLGVPTAEIRRYVTDADLADQNGQEDGDDDVLMDLFEVTDVRVMFFDGTMTISGYMEGADGIERDGQRLRRFGADAPLVRVEWNLR
jgi:hypothetical protein